MSSHTSIYSKLWSFGIRSLRSRECGLYEASDILLGDHLCEKSKTVKWVAISHPHQRKRSLIDHSKPAGKKPRFNRYFQRQPHSILRDLIIWRTCACTTLLQSTSSAASMNTKPLSQITGFSIPKRSYYSFLLFVPFRNEAELIEEGENAERAFNRHMANNSALNTHSEKLQKMLKATECAKD